MVGDIRCLINSCLFLKYAHFPITFISMHTKLIVLPINLKLQMSGKFSNTGTTTLLTSTLIKD